MFRSALVAFALAASLAAPALAFTASNGLPVKDEGNGTFYVGYHGESGATAFWCAAAQYGTQALGLRLTDHIWRVSPPPRRAGEGIRFSVRPEGAAQSSGLLHFGGEAADLSISHALEFCSKPADMLKE
ncbi:hypothetical protein SAMN04488103_107152 [Gemmobacter aquatilis]|uniref:Uncharacterized protein n=1 Tax=Gemmobacter aquatilis TaxID=933059 RepID=A0A1H8J591_9RHOB|nr:hypothetical protein [Gemmobacter aquatilis]SEN76010.1 hypothetical protein SAMN04488103_107152 [Gemmobacter aquatilis]